MPAPAHLASPFPAQTIQASLPYLAMPQEPGHNLPDLASLAEPFLAESDLSITRRSLPASRAYPTIPRHASTSLA